MAVSRSLALLAPILAALPAGAAGVARSEDNLARGTCLDIKIRLPKAETYIRGETDPVLDLKIEVTISNVMPKDDPVRGIGELYRPVKLSPHDFIQFEILPVEDVAAEGGEGGGEPKPKPKPIRRDMPLLPAEPENLRDSKYLGPGESETVVVDAGRHYLIDRPGIYSIKARMFGPNGIVSNEEKFRVLPFKKVDQSAAELERLWKQYERDRLEFPFMVYQVRTNAAFDEVIYVQRVVNSRTDHYEFHRLCSVYPGAVAEVAYLGPKKVAVLSRHARGDWALYELDFSPLDPKVTVAKVEPKGEAAPRIKVEGGKASAE